MATTTRFDFAGGEPDADVLIAWLEPLPFHAFEAEPAERVIGAPQSKVIVSAYASSGDVDAALRGEVERIASRVGVSVTEQVLPDINYNARWEAAYTPVEIGEFLRIRAPFHPPTAGFSHELVIVPEMSFGTGHHATTTLMAEYLRDLPPVGKTVLDLGTGTGVLAILAARLHAARVDATDIDARCVASTEANARRNGVTLRTVRVGTDVDLPAGPYDLILANINRAVLLRAMRYFAARLAPGGELWLSGILVADLDVVDNAAFDGGLTRREQRQRAGWVACRYAR